MFQTIKDSRPAAALCVLAAIVAIQSCGGKGYQVNQQAPARYITEERSEADAVSHDVSGCGPFPQNVQGSYDFLEVLVNTGGRRSGTAGYRCAAEFAERSLLDMGYRVDRHEYGFPYYEFDLAEAEVLRASDGKKYPAYPMHYATPTRGPLMGMLKRPRGDLAGCFVYYNPEEPSHGSITDKYEKWRDKGALGVVREATLEPLAQRGHHHSARMHATSWRYAPLAGVVVENAHELLGETITVDYDARIARGSGLSLAAMGNDTDNGYVVVTAHLDCWFDGALDDGSGSAVLLEAARLMKDDRDGVIFLLADSEEIGLIGSAVFAQRFDLGRVRAVIELDMVSGKNNYGRNKTPETAGLMPRFHTYTPGTKSLAREAFGELGGRHVYVPMGAMRWLMGGLATDMEWFYTHGVPGVFVYTPSNYYHTEHDDMSWVPREDIEDMARAVVRLARKFREEAPPTKRVISFEPRVSTAGGDTIRIEVEPAEGFDVKKAEGGAYFEMGFENELEFERDDDTGLLTAEFKPPWPGVWQFLVKVEKGRNLGKRWAVYEAPELSRPLEFETDPFDSGGEDGDGASFGKRRKPAREPMRD